MATFPDYGTTTDRWTCHVYPLGMYPDGVVERPISVLFEDECNSDIVSSLNLTAAEAKQLASALLKAAAAREA